MKSNEAESAELIELKQKNIIEERWIPFLSKYHPFFQLGDVSIRIGNKDEPLSEEEKMKYQKSENVYRLCFEQIDYECTLPIKYEQDGKFYIGHPYNWLTRVCTRIKNRYKHDNGYWRYFPNSAIAGYIFGFFSVISWVGMGYFANAIRSATTKGESKFNVFINSLAGIFDTVACGFILYSLIVGAPMFSIPMIIAAAVSVLLRVIFTVFIFNNIDKNKKLIDEYVYMDKTLPEIEKYLKQHKPEEVPEPYKGVKEFQEKPKEQINENEKSGGDNKEKIGKGN